MNYYNEKKLTEKISFLVVLQYSIMTIKNMFAATSVFFESINGKMNLLIILFFAFMYLKFMLENIKKINILYSQIFLLLSILIFWLISYIFNPALFSYSYVNSELRDFIAYSLPILLVVPMINETSTMLDYFYKASYFIFVGAVLAAIIGLINNSSSTNIYTAYDMAYGRNAMLPSILLYSKAITENNKKDFYFASLLIGLIILLGSRFPILCIIFFLFIRILFMPTLKRYKKFMFIFFGGTVSILMYFNISSLATSAMKMLSAIGIQSRTLLLLSLGMGGSSSGREEIHAQLYDAINQSPILGYGAGAGTVLLDNGLSHGFFIDVFANLGYIVGGGLLFASFIVILKAYNKSIELSGKELLLILVSNFLPISTIQLSLWSADMFWFSLALSFAIFKLSKNNSLAQSKNLKENDYL